jgi:hypothetical protein
VGIAATWGTLALRSLHLQVREAMSAWKASERRADEYARMVMELVSQRVSASRRSGPR